ncbi:MAG TPA: hypothetical protein DDX71_03165 [Ruminococcus sp.]|nr:hypothetical protein [Ruminococcus sp.]
MKRIKNSFFAKTFTISLLMLFIITMTAYLLLYLLLPVFYRRFKISEYEEKAAGVIRSLSQADSDGSDIEILTDFAQRDAADVTVYNADGSIYFRITEKLGVSILHGNSQQQPDGKSVFQMEIDESGSGNAARMESEYPYSANGIDRTLVLDIPLQPLDEAKSVIINIYPFAGLLCIVFSFLLAILFSRNVVDPIRHIQHTVREMAQLSPDAQIPVRTGDEIAQMSRDINSMYEELRSTIIDLEAKIKAYTSSENQKIAFLRNVSHELKTPLASANALIEGIVYGISPYCDDKEKYLNECRDFLQKAITLTKESLSLSPVYKESPQTTALKSLVETEFRPYKVILKSRQIRYCVDIPPQVTITTSLNLFSKAISNVLSNAANYTDNGGTVRIRYRMNRLCIENTCTPLSPEELKRVMKPMHSGQNSTQYSNGLGLFIVEQSLGLMQIPFSFAPMEDGSGMCFSFTLK